MLSARAISLILLKGSKNLSYIAHRDTTSKIYRRPTIKSILKNIKIITGFLVRKRVSPTTINNN